MNEARKQQRQQSAKGCCYLMVMMVVAFACGLTQFVTKHCCLSSFVVVVVGVGVRYYNQMWQRRSQP